ncbi:MAG: hypothetical protein IPI64_00060 [Chloracidobacterium sp.]|nr:hypothetical protein [Chloracidobacterium sp.]
MIPITGDAVSETSGHVLRLQTADKREAFDRDLRKFAAEVGQGLAGMQTNAKKYKQTDIVGSLRVAQDEIAVTEKENHRVVLVVLSDMVNCTQGLRMDKDAVFQKPDMARQHATTFAQNMNFDWRSSEIYLGVLESTDLQQMSSERRDGVREFWAEFFHSGGAVRYQFATDGIGQLPKFINYKEKS